MVVGSVCSFLSALLIQEVWEDLTFSTYLYTRNLSPPECYMLSYHILGKFYFNTSDLGGVGGSN